MVRADDNFDVVLALYPADNVVTGTLTNFLLQQQRTPVAEVLHNPMLSFTVVHRRRTQSVEVYLMELGSFGAEALRDTLLRDNLCLACTNQHNEKKKYTRLHHEPSISE